ncbi:dihydrodipicolinate synthase family protein [Thermoanaerobacteraceae bacterium SP2]|nr:dihydrodipicolinate synthase family protein [Thermoanaerobacteraceae bacterium SP2]
MEYLKGSLPSLITPFNEDESIDEESLRNEIDFILDEGAHGICVNALLGEGFKLTDEERKKVLEIAVDHVKGKGVRVVNGVQGNSARICIELAEHSRKLGVEALMIPPPFYYKASRKNIFDFYKMISDAVDIPIMVQDAPPIVGVEIGLDMTVKMVNEIKNVKYLKIELSKPGPEVSIYTKILKDKCPLIWGYAGAHYIEAYKRGCIGVIGTPEVPKVMYDVHNYLEAGDEKKAREIYDKYFQFFMYNIANGFHSQAVSKKVLYWKGVIKSDKVREPAQPLDELHEEELKVILRNAGEKI